MSYHVNGENNDAENNTAVASVGSNNSDCVILDCYTC